MKVDVVDGGQAERMEERKIGGPAGQEEGRDEAPLYCPSVSWRGSGASVRLWGSPIRCWLQIHARYGRYQLLNGQNPRWGRVAKSLLAAGRGGLV